MITPVDSLYLYLSESTFLDLLYLLDKDDLKNVCMLFGGMDIQVPSFRELRNTNRDFRMYKHIKARLANGEDMTDICKSCNKIFTIKADKVKIIYENLKLYCQMNNKEDLEITDIFQLYFKHTLFFDLLKVISFKKLILLIKNFGGTKLLLPSLIEINLNHKNFKLYNYIEDRLVEGFELIEAVRDCISLFDMSEKEIKAVYYYFKDIEERLITKTKKHEEALNKLDIS